jgi:hypothetical protein
LKNLAFGPRECARFKATAASDRSKAVITLSFRGRALRFAKVWFRSISGSERLELLTPGRLVRVPAKPVFEGNSGMPGIYLARACSFVYTLLAVICCDCNFILPVAGGYLTEPRWFLEAPDARQKVHSGKLRSDKTGGILKG